jgi:hypothetical protein
VGRIGAVSSNGVPLVRYEGQEGQLPARALLPLDRAALEAAAERDAEVLLFFEGGDPLRPIIAGLLAPPSLPRADAASAEPVELATVDGKRVQIRGADEIVLSCGPASITLRRNGRIVIRGADIESRSAGVQRIKGAQVKVN